MVVWNVACAASRCYSPVFVRQRTEVVRVTEKMHEEMESIKKKLQQQQKIKMGKRKKAAIGE